MRGSVSKHATKLNVCIPHGIVMRGKILDPNKATKHSQYCSFLLYVVLYIKGLVALKAPAL